MTRNPNVRNTDSSAADENLLPELDWQFYRDRLSEEVSQKAERLEETCRLLSRPVLAFSGGIDSALVAAFLSRFSLDPIAVTAVSPSLSRRQKSYAEKTARQIGLNHHWMETEEFLSDGYRANGSNRCYFCKSHLYQKLLAIAQEYPNSKLVSGTNLDDLGDYRPGLGAAEEFEVVQPLVACEINKKEVREISASLGLLEPLRPASPCLASRIAYGLEVSPDRLVMIEKAEEVLWNKGFSNLRVRMMADRAAKIEVPKQELRRLEQPEFFQKILQEFTVIGFQSVSLDPEGFRSGNLNSLIDLQKTDQNST